MTLFFLFGLLAVLIITAMAMCVCAVMAGVIACIHRYLIVPVQRAKQPWAFMAGPDELPFEPMEPVERGPEDVFRYRKLLETIERKRLQLRTARGQARADLIGELWFLQADRWDYETDPQFVKLLTMPGARPCA